MWGVLDDSPVIINWNGLDPTEQADITPTFETSNNWIIFTHHTFTRRGRCRHSHSPGTERRPENTSYERQSRQGERVVEDGKGRTCLVRPRDRVVD